MVWTPTVHLFAVVSVCKKSPYLFWSSQVTANEKQIAVIDGKAGKILGACETVGVGGGCWPEPPQLIEVKEEYCMQSLSHSLLFLDPFLYPKIRNNFKGRIQGQLLAWYDHPVGTFASAETSFVFRFSCPQIVCHSPSHSPVSYSGP